MTVEQNIAAAIKNDRKIKENIVSEKIKAFYLEGLEKQYPNQLSGGQQQRVALARLMAQNPEILMLDEPFSAMDNYLKWQLEQEVAELLQSYSKPVLFVSHNCKEAYRMCDKVAVLYNGKLDTICSKNEIFKLPRSVAVAQLIGCKNLSRIQRCGEHRIFAVDWGVELETAKSVPETVGHIGFFGHFIRLAKAKDKNTIDCSVLRVIEDKFSLITILKPKGASGIKEYTKILWEMNKAHWQEVKYRLDTVTIALETEHIMLLD
jgi:molybdate transport system ATP-binding protein